MSTGTVINLDDLAICDYFSLHTNTNLYKKYGNPKSESRDTITVADVQTGELIEMSKDLQVVYFNNLDRVNWD
jgi:hypothetical protein